MSLTGYTENTHGLPKILLVKVWPIFKMSYLYMRGNYRGCGFDLNMPLSQHQPWNENGLFSINHYNCVFHLCKYEVNYHFRKTRFFDDNFCWFWTCDEFTCCRHYYPVPLSSRRLVVQYLFFFKPSDNLLVDIYGF